MRAVIATLFFTFILASVSIAASFSGKVVKVADGDTVSVMHNGVAEKVRLAEIDCPEQGQAYGSKAKQFVNDRVAGKAVTVKVHTTDRYGRTVGEIIMLNGKSLNRELVQNGFAWHYKIYSNNSSLGSLEKAARMSKIGLWADPYPVAPWDWRRGKRAAKQVQKNDKSYLKATNSTSKSAEAAVYHGNIKSNIFHKPGCRYFNCKNCTATFSSYGAAVSAGYRPCKKCQ